MVRLQWSLALLSFREQETLAQAQVTVGAMDLKPLALIRAVEQAEAIIANLEQDELSIMLVSEGLPALVRTFSLEGEILDEDGESSDWIEIHNPTDKLSVSSFITFREVSPIGLPSLSLSCSASGIGSSFSTSMTMG